MPISAIQIVEPVAVKAAVIRLTILRHEIQTHMGPGIQEIQQVLQQQNISIQGPMFAHHLTTSSTEFDLEVGFAVSDDVRRQGRVYPSSTPSGKAAHVTHSGSYDALYDAWKQFGEIMNEKGLVPKGETLWEVYTVGPETTTDAKRWKTDLFQPIE